MNFWQKFERTFGPPSERPESYWSAGLGHWCHVRIRDIADMTPQQLLGCAELIERATK